MDEKTKADILFSNVLIRLWAVPIFSYSSSRKERKNKDAQKLGAEQTIIFFACLPRPASPQLSRVPIFLFHSRRTIRKK